MGNDTDSHELLSVVATVHHQGVGETLDDWAVSLSESLLRISTGGVRDIDWCSDLDVIAVEKYLALVLCSSYNSPHFKMLSNIFPLDSFFPS